VIVRHCVRRYKECRCVSLPFMNYPAGHLGWDSPASKPWLTWASADGLQSFRVAVPKDIIWGVPGGAMVRWRLVAIGASLQLADAGRVPCRDLWRVR
jgi:hypothetical protein